MSFAILPPDLEQQYGGDWNNPGIYALHHIPTGLEYVGASNCVKARLKAHAAQTCAWKIKLQGCLAVINHGPQVITTEGGRVYVLHSVEQIAALPSTHVPAEDLEDRGLVGPIDCGEVLPIFLEYVSPRMLASREIEHVKARRPALNSPSHVNYPSERVYAEAARAIGECQRGAARPPRPVPVPVIKSIWIKKALAELEHRDRLCRASRDRARRKIAEAMEDIAFERANRFAEEVYQQELWILNAKKMFDCSPTFLSKQSKAFAARLWEATCNG